MHFTSLTQEQQDIVEWAHAFAEKEVRPHAAYWDEKEQTPWPIIEKAHEMGLYSLDFVTTLAFDESGLLLPSVLEELAWGDAGIALALFGTTLAATAVLANGTPEQVGLWAPQLFEQDGKPAVGAFCSSEPGAGSDVSSIRTRAIKDGTDWVLRGQKMWVTNGGLGGVHVVVASIEPELGAKGHGVFVVPAGTPGLSMGQKILKHGIRASHTAEVVLEDVRIPGDCLLGGQDRLDEKFARARQSNSGGLNPSARNGAMATFEASRPAVGAMAVGIARAATEYAVEYAKTREQFGKPIAATQGVGFTLAEMATRTDAARLLVHRASSMAAKQVPFTKAEGSMAKLYAGETAAWVSHQAMLICGGNGYTREYPVERMHRDSIIFQTFEGTENIQKAVIGRALTGHRIV